MFVCISASAGSEFYVQIIRLVIVRCLHKSFVKIFENSFFIQAVSVLMLHSRKPISLQPIHQLYNRLIAVESPYKTVG